MATVQELTDLLVKALRDRPRRVEYVKRFQEIVWASEDLRATPELTRVLRDLAYDLDLFEPDEQVRAEDPSLYGDARLEEEIRSALQRLAPEALEGLG